MLSTIGKLAWGSAGWAMPSLGLIPYFVAAATVVVSLTSGYAYFRGAEGKSAAVAQANASCEVRIAEGARASAERLAHVMATIKAGDEAETEPKSSAEEKDLCRKSRLCRR